MAGVNQAANLSGMLSQISDTLGRERDISSLTRGIENMSRPNVDPTNAAQLEGLMNWQQRMGREDAARTTLARVEQVKAEQLEAGAIESARKTAEIRGQMDKIAADPTIPQEQKQIRLRGLQASLNTLSTTEDQVNLNSGYDVKTLSRAEQEARLRAGEERAAAEAVRAEERAKIARDEADRSKRGREATAAYALAQTDEERDSVRSSNKEFAAEFRRMDSERLQLEALEEEANNATVEMSEAPNLSAYEGKELSPAAKARLARAKALAGGYDEKTGTWKSQVARQNYNKAIESLHDEQVLELRAETRRINELNANLEAQSLSLQLQQGVVEPRAIQAQVESAAASLGYDEDDLNELDEDEYGEVMDLAKKRATALHNETVFAGLANVRMAEDPTAISNEEISKANGGEFEGERARIHFDEFRRKYIARLRGREPGGQQETLSAYRKFNEVNKERKTEESAPEQGSGFSPINPFGVTAEEAYSADRFNIFDRSNETYDRFKANMEARTEANRNR